MRSEISFFLHILTQIFKVFIASRSLVYNLENKEIFNQVSDVIRNCGRFAVFCSVIGPENSHNSILTPITNWLPAFSRALVPAFLL